MVLTGAAWVVCTVRMVLCDLVVLRAAAWVVCTVRMVLCDSVVLRAAAWVVYTVWMVLCNSVCCMDHVYGADGAVRISCTAPSAPYARPTWRLLRPPPIQKLSAENHMLQLNI